MEWGALKGSLALLMAVLGVFMLRTASRSTEHNTANILFGWALLGLCVIVGTTTTSKDKGAAIGVVIIILASLVFIGLQYCKSERRLLKIRERKYVPATNLRPSDYLKRIWTGLLIGPLSGLSALAIAGAAFVALDFTNVEHTLNLLMSCLLFPILWACFAFIAGFKMSPFIKEISVLGSGCASALYLTLVTII